MSEQPKSKGEMVIEQIMEDLDPNSPRYQVLATAKTFKSSWVALGEKLVTVKKGTMFREWGYQSFDEYCSAELRIKKPTADKLTLAYRFMEKEEPQLMAREAELKPLPDYRSVELLRQAKEEKDFSEDEYAELRKAVVEDNRSHPTVAKRFKEVAAAKPGAEIDPNAATRSALAAARRLDTSLGEVPGIAEEYREELRRLIFQLEARMEENPGEE
ncbi:MAG: hypothetical protein GWO11_03815 [Desulfuromonadales bacterium]|nr:hypothetical protein [Desulfuromonadales bacterium]NIR33566.1 hypothetical protein [Desulfuromonadales bacterium]NIS41156.1 hypothetical protein [Desulfuromonadales bacterium]